MTDRYGKRDAQLAMARLASAVGKPWADGSGKVWRGSPYNAEELGKLWDDGRAYVGAWYLGDEFHGFIVYEMGNDGGGVSCPLGHNQRRAREFCEAVRFALDALQVAAERVPA